MEVYRFTTDRFSTRETQNQKPVARHTTALAFGRTRRALAFSHRRGHTKAGRPHHRHEHARMRETRNVNMPRETLHQRTRGSPDKNWKEPAPKPLQILPFLP